MKRYRVGIRGKIMSGYIALLICLMIASIILNKQITELQVERNELISYDVNVRSTAQQLEQEILRMDAYIQRYRLTDDLTYFQQFEQQKQLWHETYKQLENIVYPKMGEDEALHTIERHVKVWLDILPDVDQLTRVPSTFQESEKLFNRFEQLFSNFYVEHDAVVKEELKSLDHTNRFLAINLFVALAITAIITMLIFQFIATKIVTSVRQVSTAISTMASADTHRQTMLKSTTHDEVYDLVQATNTLIATMEHEQWLQTNVAQTMTSYQGATTLEELANIVLQQVTMRTKSASSTCYVKQQLEGAPFTIIAAIALKESSAVKDAATYEQVVAQCIETQKPVRYLHEQQPVTTGYIADVALHETYALPVIFEEHVVAVMVYSSFTAYSDIQRAFMEQIARGLGIIIDHVKSRMHIEELLIDSQQLTEELKVQSTSLYDQAEMLKNVNAELAERTTEAEYKTKVLEETKQSLQRKAEQLQQASTYKSAFLANMSHELRTPLNSILALSDMLQHNVSNEEDAKYASVIHQSGTHLLSIINDILDLSKVEAGKMELTISPINIEEVCAQTAALFEPIAQQKHIELICDASQAPKIMYTDEKRLLQIIHNVVGNALKFTKEGHVALTFSEAVLQDEEALQITVADTGIGIPRNKQQMIFESFQQVDHATIRQYGGTGLGLAICRQFTQLLGGSITVESEEHVGSTFTITLPLHLND